MDSQKLFVGSFLLILYFQICSCKDTITINQDQTFLDGDLLISKGGKFALGFFSPGNSRFRYLGIWYYKVPEPTVVWVANRNSPINGSSTVLSISKYGNLILYSDPSQKAVVWSTNVSVEVTEACEGQLLDSGNLVLVGITSKRIMWQSFDYPTDTLLQGMKLGFNRKTGTRQFLTSWRSADDPGTGEYSVEIKPTGSPQIFLYKGRNYIWRSPPWPWRTYADIVTFNFTKNQYETYVYFVAEASLTVRIVLDFSGTRKHLIWHQSDGKWKEFWTPPSYRCEAYGHCGTNSKCDPDLIDLRFECNCLPGFEPNSAGDWHILRDGSGGCVRKKPYPLIACGRGEGFVKVANVKLPDTSAAVWLDTNMKHMECEKECKRNCSCTAYSSIDIPGEGTGCLAWYGELNDTVQHYSGQGYDLYVRVDAVELASNNSKPKSITEVNKTILALSVVSAWIIVIFFAYVWHKKKRKSANNRWNKRFLDAISDPCHQIDSLVGNEVRGGRSHTDIAFFSLRTLIDATNNFSPSKKLGQGGFGSVYKGCLTNGLEIAIKRLSKDSGQGLEEFKNEVTLIAKLQHVNLVKLLGCCVQGEEPMLIYEYLPNKSLDSLLLDETRRSILNWTKRFHIIVGIARGLLYLHEHSRFRIIHRDMKTSNILLDGDMNPKIADFGIARISERGQMQERTRRVSGTYGYMAPEYVVFGKFSIKSDVFGYGVILLEIITGKKNNGFCLEDSSVSMLEHVMELWKEDRALEIVDSLLKESSAAQQILRCIQIGLLCVQAEAIDRPTMSEVVLMLNTETTLPAPNQPAFVLRKSCKSFTEANARGSCSVNDMTVTTISGR